MLYKPVTITVDALARVLKATGAGLPHVTLAHAAIWSDPQTERAAEQTAWQSFADAGLLDSHGRDSDRPRWLAALARPSSEYFGWITHEGTTTAALAAAIGDEAVLAVRRGHHVRITPIDPGRLAETLIACLPDIPAGQGQSFTVPVGRLRAAPGESEVDAPADSILVTEPVHNPGLAAFSRLAALQTVGAGELYSGACDRRTGRRAIQDQPVGYHDTVEGRWLAQVVPGHGDDWLVAAPATPDLLLTRLHQARRALAV